MDEKSAEPQVVFRRFHSRQEPESRISHRKHTIGVALVIIILYLGSGGGIRLAHSWNAKDSAHSNGTSFSSSPQVDLRFDWSAVSLTSVLGQILTNNNSSSHPRISSILPASMSSIAPDLTSL